MPDPVGDNSIAIAVLSGALTVCVAIAVFYANGKRTAFRKAQDENKLLLDRVFDLESKMAVVSQAVVPISAAFQAILIKELTHEHDPEMDLLMAKLGPPITASATELIRLGHMLEERGSDPERDDMERDAARMLPMVIKRVEADLRLTGLSAEPLIHIAVETKASSVPLDEAEKPT